MDGGPGVQCRDRIKAVYDQFLRILQKDKDQLGLSVKLAFVVPLDDPCVQVCSAISIVQGAQRWSWLGEVELDESSQLSCTGSGTKDENKENNHV